MLSVVLDILVCTEPIASRDLTPPQPQNGCHGTEVIIEPEGNCDEGDCGEDDDKEEFEMDDEEQS